jgi:hypothetical protein
MATHAPREPKAQHYIPKFYLKGFTDKQGRLWVCEKFKPIRSSKPKHEAHRPDYYTHAEQGQRDETAEDTLEAIESRAAPVVCKLANPAFRPTPELMGHVYLFIAFMFARVPIMREYLDKLLGQVVREEQLSRARDKDTFHKLCADMERETGKLLGIDHEELHQCVLKGEYEIVQTSTAFNLGSMFESALRVARELQNFGYQVLYAPKGEFFLTSDAPVFTLQPDGTGLASFGMGFGWSDVEVHFPLNKRACLRLKRGIGPEAVGVTNPAVVQINRATMMNASRYLYSSEGYRRTSRLFDQWGCKIEPGKNAFLPTAETPKL